MKRLFVRAMLALVTVGLAAAVLTACSGKASDQPKIGFSIDDLRLERWTRDRDYFVAAAEKLGAKVYVQSADGNEQRQVQQLENLISRGVNVLVIVPYNSKVLDNVIAEAKRNGIKVISYDRLILGADIDAYISFDNEKVGELQGQALLDALDKAGTTDSGDVVMINGAPTDPNAAQFKKGAESVLDGQVTIGKEFDTPDWSPDKAQSEMQSAITSIGADQIVGVYSANDGMATGISAAMKSAGMTPPPPLTGQDAELSAIQRLLSGDQTMTVYKAIGPEAEAAAGMAVALIQGEDYPDASDSVNNGTADVPSQLLEPVVVTADNVNDMVVKDGFYTTKEICTSQYAADCKKYGVE